MIRGAIAAALLLASFSGHACTAGSPQGGEIAAGLPVSAGPLDALNRRHGRLRQRMRLRGYGQPLALTRTFLLEGRGVAWPLDLAVNQCSSFLALGGGTIRDLGLTLYDGDGLETATALTSTEGGLLHVCPQGKSEQAPTRPYYLTVQVREGTGAVMVGHFQTRQGEGEGFQGLFESILAPHVPFRGVEELLAGHRSALRERNFSPMAPPSLEHLGEGAALRLPVQASAERCYVVTGRSGEGLEDVDLYLFDPAGVEVARDLGTDAEPSIEYCPTQGGRFIVELRAFEGSGAVGVMVLEGPRAQEELAAEEAAEIAAVEAGRGDLTPLRGEGGADPSLALGVLAGPLVARGFAEPLFAIRNAAITPGEVRSHDVVVGPGCALVAGAASDQGMDLDLYLADTERRVLDRDTGVESTARVRACRDHPTVLRVAVKAYGREGRYALAVMRAPSQIGNLQSLRLEEAAAPFWQRNYLPRSPVSIELAEGRGWHRPISLEPGTCVAAVAAGDTDVHDLDVFLTQDNQALVASDSGPEPSGAVSRCAPADASLSLILEVRSSRGSGNAIVLVLKTERTPTESSAPGRLLPQGSVQQATTPGPLPRVHPAP